MGQFTPARWSSLSGHRWGSLGGRRGLADLRGRVVVLEVFQMLCPGCVAHGLPQARRIAQVFAGRDVAVLGLHTDADGALSLPAKLTIDGYFLLGDHYPPGTLKGNVYARMERALMNQGFLDRGSDGQWRLSPKAMRQLGQAALRDVAQQLSGRHGERDTRRAGAAGELTGATRPWQFGDTEPWNVTRTLTNAVLRQAGTDPDGPLRITVDDVEISETETRTQAVVALLVDTSFSMVMENRWLPMKRTALALNHLVSTRFRSDALQIIAFGRHARTVTAAELTGLEGVYEQGTNLHHALLLAARHLRRHPNAQPVILVVTDGEPTAHLEQYRDGAETFFDYPPHPRTIAFTVRSFDEVARMGAQITIFRLGSDPGLARFIDQVARRVEGRVVEPELDGLGAAVVGDYLRSRRRRR